MCAEQLSFVKTEGNETYLFSLYVDDILIVGTDSGKIAEIKSEFTQRYEMKDLGALNYYLGMKAHGGLHTGPAQIYAGHPVKVRSFAA